MFVLCNALLSKCSSCGLVHLLKLGATLCHVFACLLALCSMRYSTHRRTGTHSFRYSHTHTYRHTHTNTHTHTHTHVDTHKHTHTNTHARTHAHTHAHKYTHTNTHARTHAHTHALAHTCKQPRTRHTQVLHALLTDTVWSASRGTGIFHAAPGARGITAALTASSTGNSEPGKSNQALLPTPTKVVFCAACRGLSVTSAALEVVGGGGGHSPAMAAAAAPTSPTAAGGGGGGWLDLVRLFAAVAGAVGPEGDGELRAEAAAAVGVLPSLHVGDDMCYSAT